MAFTRYLLICREKGIERIIKEACGVAGIAIPRVGDEIEHVRLPLMELLHHPKFIKLKR